MPTTSAWIASLLSLFVVSGASGPVQARLSRATAGYQSADAPARQSRTPDVVMGTKEERVAKAATNYAQNRPVEAALGFEGLWKDFPTEPDFLFNAAASRFAAGHFAHAIAYTREFLAAKNIESEARKEAEAQLREALPQTVSVAVTATADAAAPNVTIVTKYIPRESGDVRPDLLFAGGQGGTTSLQLDPGFWDVRVQAEGLAASERRIEVIKGQTAVVTLRLTAAPKDVPTPMGPNLPREVPPAVVRRHLLGFGVAGGVFAAVGVGMVAAGSVKAGKAETCEGPKFAGCALILGSGLSIRATGTQLLGGGLGLIAGSLPWLARDAEVRRKVWIAETAMGAVFAVGGVAMAIVSGKRFIEANRTIDDWDQHYADYGRLPLHAVGNTLLGFGVGTAIGAVSGMLVQRKHLRNLGVQAAMGRGQAGLVVSGRF